MLNLPICSAAKNIAFGAAGYRRDSPAGRIAQCRQRLATAAVFFRSCVAQALSHGNRPRHSLHASAYYREYNKDLIFLFFYAVI